MSSVAHNGFYVTIATSRGATTKKVEGDLLSVGRADDCNLSIAHDTLNRRHMSVQLRNGECWIEDHGSANGTFVNGKRIQAHAPTRVRPDDTVVLAQSGVKICVSTEPIMPRDITPTHPTAADNIVTTTTVQRQQLRAAQSPALPRTPEETENIADDVIQEAIIKSAKLLEDAQMDAERRVQEIYRRAHETQSKIESSYQSRLSEAYRAAEGAFHKSQMEAAHILQSARLRSAEIRHQSENFVLELRQRTESDCERILSEAQQTARELKENRLHEAEEMIAKKEEMLLHHTRQAMADRMARLEEELEKETSRHRDMIEAEVSSRRSQLEQELKDQRLVVENLKLEAKNVMALKAQEQAALLEVGQQIDSQRALVKTLQEEIEIAQKTADESKSLLAKINAEIEMQQKEQSAREVTIKESREKLKWMQEELRTGDNRVKTSQEDIQNQLLHLKERFEQERVRLNREEQKRHEELKLETTRQVQALEQALLNEVYSKRDRLNREIMLTVEKFMKEKPETKGLGLRRLEDDIAQLLQDQIVTMSQGKTAKSKQKTLISLRRREKVRTIIFGALVGATLLWVGQTAYHTKFDPAPMQNKVAAAAEQRKQDLEKRKFNPAQTREYRSTYVDNVIYQEGFVATYTSDEFQNAFFKSLAAYMFKTWRLEEEKVIQILATSTALTRELQSKREAIHPDFVNQSLEKMKDFEKEMTAKMRDTLGSQVRFESFKKFEKKFFEGYKPTAKN